MSVKIPMIIFYLGTRLKYGFCKNLLRYQWTSDKLNTFVLTFFPNQHWSGQKVRQKVFNWSEVHLYRSNFLQNPYFSYNFNLLPTKFGPLNLLIVQSYASLYDLCYVIAMLLFFKYSLCMRQKKPAKSLNSTLSMMDNIFWDIKSNLSGNIPNYRKPM